MDRWFGRSAEPLYSIFRLVVGFLFLQHGLQKLFGAFPDPERGPKPAPEPFTQMWFGGWIELVCGVLVMIGLGARWAAFLACGTMAVAFFQFHFKAAAPLPIQNHGEPAVLFCFAFLYVFGMGDGIWSVANFMKNRKALPQAS